MKEQVESLEQIKCVRTVSVPCSIRNEGIIEKKKISQNKNEIIFSRSFITTLQERTARHSEKTMTWTTESQRDNQGHTTKFQNIQNTVHELISLASQERKSC